MKITNELLAAYAEGNVSNEEKKEVRHYLMQHPKELESIMVMMDDDYELFAKKVDDDKLKTKNNIRSMTHDDNSSKKLKSGLVTMMGGNLGCIAHPGEISTENVADGISPDLAAFKLQKYNISFKSAKSARDNRKPFDALLNDLLDELKS